MKGVLKGVNIVARDLPEAWFLCIQEMFNYGYEYKIDKSSSGQIKRLEFDWITVHVIFPGARPLLPDIPPGMGFPPPADIEYVEKDYLLYVMTSEIKPGEDYTYGQDLEEQFERVINHYKKYGPNLNHCYMAVGDKNTLKFYDKPGGTSQCLRGIDTRIRYGKLHFFPYFRSWDLWAGFPVNLAAIQIMKEEMAKAIGVEDGEIIASSKGLHLYDYTWDFARTRVGLK